MGSKEVIRAMTCCTEIYVSGSMPPHSDSCRLRCIRTTVLCGLAQATLQRGDQAAAAQLYQDAVKMGGEALGDVHEEPCILAERAAAGMARAGYGWLLFEQGQTKVQRLCGISAM